MMMFTDPVGTVLVPPRAVVPRVMVVPIAVGATPILVVLSPFGMMPVHPAGMIFMPPIGIVPRMMFVPIAVMMMLGMGYHRRSREERGQCCASEKSSKFHSWYLLKEQWKWRKSTSQGAIGCIENASFRWSKKSRKISYLRPASDVDS